MRTPLIARVIVITLIASAVSSAQAPSASARDALVDVLVWGTYIKIDPRAYSSALKAEIERHLSRSEAYRSPRPRPAKSAELSMVYGAQVRYERRLVAVSQDPRAQTLAVAYVDSLRPCYEWEGFHGCPEREAMFAEEYQATHPGGPFSEYLPLLAAHRWLCTAEAYEGEKRPEDAARSRRAYEQEVLTASKSAGLLVRTAAEGLRARGRCLSSR